jgi:hypothetical protein
MYVQLKDGRSDVPYITTTPTVVYPQPCPERAEALREVVYQRYTRSADDVKSELVSRRQHLQAAIAAKQGNNGKVITEE